MSQVSNLLKKAKLHFLVWLQNQFISAGLEPVLSHTEKSCVCVCVCVCVCTIMYVCMSVCLCKYMHVCECVCAFVSASTTHEC